MNRRTLLTALVSLLTCGCVRPRVELRVALQSPDLEPAPDVFDCDQCGAAGGGEIQVFISSTSDTVCEGCLEDGR